MSIETIYPDEENRGSAIGRVVVKEIRDNVTIDFEKFEMLYLTVRVRDKNTVLGDDYDECKYEVKICFEMYSLTWVKLSVFSKYYHYPEISIQFAQCGRIHKRSLD